MNRSNPDIAVPAEPAYDSHENLLETCPERATDVSGKGFLRVFFPAMHLRLPHHADLRVLGAAV